MKNGEECKWIPSKLSLLIYALVQRMRELDKHRILDVITVVISLQTEHRFTSKEATWVVMMTFQLLHLIPTIMFWIAS